ncbi:MAG: hypothetical protein ACRD0R_13340, partial [Acidimicrobiales bacterium]
RQPHPLSWRSWREDMKVVIAGGSGSVGRRVAGDLAQRNHEVVITPFDDALADVLARSARATADR